MPFGLVEYQDLLGFLPFATDVPHNGTVSPIDHWEQQTTRGWFSMAPDFLSISGQVFSERLTKVFNTVWQASLAPSSIPLGASAKFTASAEVISFRIQNNDDHERCFRLRRKPLVHHNSDRNFADTASARHCGPYIEIHSNCSRRSRVHLHHDNGESALQRVKWREHLGQPRTRSVYSEDEGSTGTKSKAMLPLGKSTMRLISQKVDYPRKD